MPPSRTWRTFTRTSEVGQIQFIDTLQRGIFKSRICHAHARDAGDLDKSSDLHSVVFRLLTRKALSERVIPEFDR